jgi:putative membrane protein
MIRSIASTLVVAGLLCSAAWAEDQDRQKQQDQSAAGAQQSDQPGANAKDRAASDASSTDDKAQPAAGRQGQQPGDDQAQQDPTQAFIADAYSSNLFEVQLGQIAAQRVQDDQIKQFARTMVQDHTKANQQLKQIAQSAGIQVREQLDPVHQAKLQKLQKCPAADFDRKYINTQVAGHMANVLEFRWQSQHAQKDEAKQYAAQTLPKLQEHLRHATDLANEQAGGEARTAGERQPAGDASSPRERSTTPGQRSGSRTGTSSDASSPDGAAGTDSDASAQPREAGKAKSDSAAGTDSAEPSK